MLGQQAGEPARALVVDRARHAYGRAPDPARGQAQDRHDRAAAAADRPVGRQRVGLGGDAARHAGRTRDGDEGAVAADELLAQGREGGTFLGDRLREGVGAAEVVGECQVDHPVGLGGAGAKDVQVGEGSPERLGAGRLGGQRGRVGAGEREDGVAVAEQLGDDGGADQAGATGDEDAHGTLPEVMGLLSHHSSRVTGQSPITYDGPMARWEPGARERLVVAAVDLFTEQGYDATTVAQIAERAGVTKSTFFRHFPDKRELLVAGQETLSRLLAEGIAEAPVSASPLEAVAAGLERASSAMGPMNRELGPRLKAAVAASAELQERDALKSVGLAAAMTTALVARGVPDPTAHLAGELGVLAFKRGYAEWSEGDRDAEDELARYTLAALDELRAATASLG